MDVSFKNRTEAGKELATRLTAYSGRLDVIVLALPRGGVPVAFEVARALDVPLDVFIVRKLGVPGNEELAMGAIATGGVRVLDKEIVRQLSQDVVNSVARRETEELARRDRLYRGQRPKPNVADRTVILVDDGLATGATMLAAVLALRRMRPAKLIIAVPVAAPEVCAEFRNEVDEIICAVTPDLFVSWDNGMRSFRRLGTKRYVTC